MLHQFSSHQYQEYAIKHHEIILIMETQSLGTNDIIIKLSNNNEHGQCQKIILDQRNFCH